MGKIKNMFNKKTTQIAVVLGIFLLMASPEIAFAADAGQVKAKITNAGNIVKGVLTGIVVLVGVIVSLFIIIKRMPSLDDPHEKNEMFKSVGRVFGGVALAAAVVWLVPWVYGLFV